MVDKKEKIMEEVVKKKLPKIDTGVSDVNHNLIEFNKNFEKFLNFFETMISKNELISKVKAESFVPEKLTDVFKSIVKETTTSLFEKIQDREKRIEKLLEQSKKNNNLEGISFFEDFKNHFTKKISDSFEDMTTFFGFNFGKYIKKFGKDLYSSIKSPLTSWMSGDSKYQEQEERKVLKSELIIQKNKLEEEIKQLKEQEESLSGKEKINVGTKRRKKEEELYEGPLKSLKNIRIEEVTEELQTLKKLKSDRIRDNESGNIKMPLTKFEMEDIDNDIKNTYNEYLNLISDNLESEFKFSSKKMSFSETLDSMTDPSVSTEITEIPSVDPMKDMSIISAESTSYVTEMQKLIELFNNSDSNFFKNFSKIFNQSKDHSLNSLDDIKEFSEPNFEREWGEAEEGYSDFKKMGKEKWIELASSGKPVRIKRNDLENVQNTDAYTPEESWEFLDEDNRERVLEMLNSGKMEMPIIMSHDKPLDTSWGPQPSGETLIGGNTRLTSMMKEFGEAIVWMFDVPSEIISEISPSVEDYSEIIKPEKDFSENGKSIDFVNSMKKGFDLLKIGKSEIYFSNLLNEQNFLSDIQTIFKNNKTESNNQLIEKRYDDYDDLNVLNDSNCCVDYSNVLEDSLGVLKNILRNLEKIKSSLVGDSDLGEQLMDADISRRNLKSKIDSKTRDGGLVQNIFNKKSENGKGSGLLSSLFSDFLGSFLGSIGSRYFGPILTSAMGFLLGPGIWVLGSLAAAMAGYYGAKWIYSLLPDSWKKGLEKLNDKVAEGGVQLWRNISGENSKEIEETLLDMKASQLIKKRIEEQGDQINEKERDFLNKYDKIRITRVAYLKQILNDPELTEDKINEMVERKVLDQERFLKVNNINSNMIINNKTLQESLKERQKLMNKLYDQTFWLTLAPGDPTRQQKVRDTKNEINAVNNKITNITNNNVAVAHGDPNSNQENALARAGSEQSG